MPYVTVEVRTSLERSALLPEDVDIAGDYLIHVRDGVDRRDLASVAFDVFHTSIGIGRRDDFDITARDSKKRLLWEPKDAEHCIRDHLGTFCGRVR